MSNIHSTTIVRGLSRAPYRDQVLVHLIGRGMGDQLSEAEEAKIRRVARFLPAIHCAREIEDARERDQPRF